MKKKELEQQLIKAKALNLMGADALEYSIT